MSLKRNRLNFIRLNSVCAILCLCLLSPLATARVFDVTKEKFASYFLLSGGSSTISNAGFANESSATSFNSSVNYNYTGEFGFIWTNKYVAWIVGVEIFRPQVLDNVVASNSSGTALYNIKSDILATAPKLGIELNLHSSSTYRSFVTAYVGSGSVQLQNDYSNVTISPTTAHTVKGKGTASLYGGTLGTEMNISDTTNISFELGYRQLNFTEIDYSSNVTSFNGAVTSGNIWKDTNGSNRALNMSGGYIAIGFRFYLM